MLKVKNVSKIYKKGNEEIKAIDNISLHLEGGDFISIIGSSGSGKSTLLLMLGGMLTPTKGDIWLEGNSLYTISSEQRALLRQKKIGFVFQTFNLIPYLTALQNVQIPLFLTALQEKEQKERAEALLEKVGLKERMHHKPSELSVGQQQRVALARMLANDPFLILADEPTGNLDPDMGLQVIDFLIDLNKEGRTLVIVTHDRQIAKRANQTWVIENGRLNQG